MTFEMSKHVALNDIHLVVLTVWLHESSCCVCGCEMNPRSQSSEYRKVHEFQFHNFSHVSFIKTQFTAHLLSTIAAAACGERNRVFRLVNYTSTRGLSREMFGWIPAMRVQWTPQCICNSFDTPVMLVAHMHSCVSGSDSCVRYCRPLDVCPLRRRGEICLSASKLDRHLLSGTFKNALHMRGCGLEIRPGLSNIGLI
jgi:hypothetical protein